LQPPTNRLDHIVWVVRKENIVAHVERAAKLFHADFEHLYGPDVTGLGVESYISWETGLDFVVPLDRESPLSASLQDFLDAKGEGIWGFVFGVADVHKAVAEAHELGFTDGTVTTTLDPEARRARARSWTRKVSDLQQVWVGSMAGSAVYLSQIEYADAEAAPSPRQEP
jgi:4-hydroxyphenylpyruvate dioxygenase-like putative hemolysin